MSRIMKKAVMCILFMFCMALMTAVPAKAASKPVEVCDSNYGKNSFKKDMTGNGKANSVKLMNYEKKDGCLSKTVVKMNGKTMLNIKYGSDDETSWVEAYYFKMSSKKIFLYIEAGGMNTTFNSIYQYDKASKKLKCVLDLRKGHVCWLQPHEIASINAKKSEISVGFSTYNAEVGPISMKFKYKYRNGKFRLVSNVTSSVRCDIQDYGDYGMGFEKNHYKVIRSFKLYKTAGGSKVAFKAKVKQVLTLKQVKFTKKNIYMKFSYKGKTGWITGDKHSKAIFDIADYIDD